MKISYFIMVCVLLVACDYSEPDVELVKLFGEHCESQGHAKGSPDFNECLKKIGEKK